MLRVEELIQFFDLIRKELQLLYIRLVVGHIQRVLQRCVGDEFFADSFIVRAEFSAGIGQLIHIRVPAQVQNIIAVKVPQQSRKDHIVDKRINLSHCETSCQCFISVYLADGGGVKHFPDFFGCVLSKVVK